MEEPKKDNLNFIISQNKIVKVDLINKEEIKRGGKLSAWYIFETSQNIQILDKDYGKSSELMRSLLEEETEENWVVKTVIFLIIGFIILCFTIFLIIYFTWEKPPDKKVVIKKDPIIELRDIELINKSKGVEKNKLPKENNNIIQPLSFEVLQKDFDLKTLNIENTKLLLENEELKQINILLIEENEELKQYLEKEKEKNTIKKDINNWLEEFKRYLGHILYEGCLKEEEDGKKNKCKDLYYNFVKNND
ncbi:MAG: hypothetical protein GQ557_02175 [Mycoplasmataceae bacterium]|nr:hypothetical protein [Mycoplasmataceae bacterium]